MRMFPALCMEEQKADPFQNPPCFDGSALPDKKLLQSKLPIPKLRGSDMAHYHESIGYYSSYDLNSLQS